jgi:hypothetical protein
VIPPGFRPLDFPVRPGRSLLERAALRHRAVHRLGALLVQRLPPGRLRQLYLERVILPYSYGCLNRRDLGVLANLYFDEDIVMRFVEPLLDFQSEYRGRQAAVGAYAEWMDEWGVVERKPVAYADHGDHLIVLVRQHTEGSASGLAIDVEIGQVYRLGRGVAVEYVEYRSWAEAIAHEG